MLFITQGPTTMTLACDCLSILWKGRLQSISLIFLLRFYPLGRSYSIGSSLPMGSPKSQSSSYRSKITLLIRTVKLSSLSTCVSPNYITKFPNSFALKAKLLSCIIIMLYLPPTVIGLKKNPLKTLVSLYILVQSMKNSLKEHVFLSENQLNRQTCLPSYILHKT